VLVNMSHERLTNPGIDPYLIAVGATDSKKIPAGWDTNITAVADFRRRLLPGGVNDPSRGSGLTARVAGIAQSPQVLHRPQQTNMSGRWRRHGSTFPRQRNRFQGR